MAQQGWAGDWHGTLLTPRGQLRMLLTIRAGENGALTAELESVDQAPGQKIPVQSVAATGGQLTFAVPAFGLSYEGTRDAAGNRITGILRQGADMSLVLERGPFPAQPVVQGLDGRREGTVRRNNAELHFVLRVTTGPGGTIASLIRPTSSPWACRSAAYRQGERCASPCPPAIRPSPAPLPATG